MVPNVKKLPEIGPPQFVISKIFIVNGQAFYSKFVRNIYLLHFVAFFHLASLLSTGVDNENVGVGNEKL